MITIMKRIIAMLLALLLMLTCFAVIAEGTETEETEEIKEKDPKYEELVVANPTVMRGEFFTEMWGNSTTDIDVRTLVPFDWETVFASVRKTGKCMVVSQCVDNLQCLCYSEWSVLSAEVVVVAATGCLDNSDDFT